MVPVGLHHRFQKRSPRLGLFRLIHQEHVHIHVPDIRGQPLTHLGIVDSHQSGVGEGAPPKAIKNFGRVLHVKTHMKTAAALPVPTSSHGVDHAGIIHGFFKKLRKGNCR